MHKQIHKKCVFTNFLRFLNKIWLFYPKLSNCKPLQLRILANIFIKVMNYPCGRLNADMSMDIDNTNIFQFFAFYEQNLIFCPHFANFRPI